jgi:hypothetical protein
MTNGFKRAAVLALAGTMTVAAVSPTLARSWRPWAAAGAGFAAGAMIGAAAANSRAYYGPGYYDSYAYSPVYAYRSGYDAYAYAPGASVVYGVPPHTSTEGRYLSPTDPKNSCATDGTYGRLDYVAC